MGPRLGSRGKYVMPLFTGLSMELQWGRDLEVAESGEFKPVDETNMPGFNGAATWKSRKARCTCLL